MRKFIRKYLPDHATVVQSRFMKPFGGWLHNPNLWHVHRRSAAGGVAVGLFCGLIPGPLQMLCAALCAVLLRVNLPVAVITTLYSNPLTIVPLYALAYELGAQIIGARQGTAVANLSFPEMQWGNWTNELAHWLVALGKPFLIGLPLLAICLAITGYFAMRVLWRIVVVLRWRTRKQRSTNQ
ncbi:MAG: DUF2062 domain-containing protein [Gallionella sp.]|nr:DUF2062 domain-containing protein [Gallionella sp.]